MQRQIASKISFSWVNLTSRAGGFIPAAGRCEARRRNSLWRLSGTDNVRTVQVTESVEPVRLRRQLADAEVSSAVERKWC